MALSGYEKVAVFLTSVGEDIAADILKNIDPKDIGRISAFMAQMKTIDKSKLKVVFDEVVQRVKSGGIYVGEEYVKNILSRGLGEEGATRILDMASKESHLETLKWVDPKALSNFLTSEHPQTIALILCLLAPSQAAEVLSSLPDEIKSDVTTRMASVESIPESAIHEIEEVLKVQFLDVGKTKGKKIGGTRMVAEILNECDVTTEQGILQSIEEENGELAESIRQFMFIFEDLVKVDDKGIRMVLREVSTEELSLALKTASEDLKQRIFKNMSQRAGNLLKEEMETRGPVKVSEVEGAQRNIVKVARKLEEEGKLIIAGKGKEEYVE